MVRATDYASGSTAQAAFGVTVQVIAGTTGQGSTYYISSTAAITIDTTTTVWSLLPFNVTNAVGALPISNGGTGATSASGAKTNLGFMTRYEQDFGDGTNTTFTINHNLGTKGITVQTYVKATGVQIFIGGESQLVPMDEMSIITAPYGVNGKIVGTLGVIGPTRMAYERVIPIVDITAKLLSNALSQ